MGILVSKKAILDIEWTIGLLVKFANMQKGEA